MYKISLINDEFYYTSLNKLFHVLLTLDFESINYFTIDDTKFIIKQKKEMLTIKNNDFTEILNEIQIYDFASYCQSSLDLSKGNDNEYFIFEQRLPTQNLLYKLSAYSLREFYRKIIIKKDISKLVFINRHDLKCLLTNISKNKLLKIIKKHGIDSIVEITINNINYINKGKYFLCQNLIKLNFNNFMIILNYNQADIHL